MIVKVLEKTFWFTEEDENTNIRIPFELSNSSDVLRILFSFNPEYGEERIARRKIKEGLKKYVPSEERKSWMNIDQYLPLRNSIALSVDYEGKYLGADLSGESEKEIVLSSQSSSEGFIQQSGDQGRWDIYLTTRTLASSEIKAQLTVIQEEGEKE